MKRILAMVLCVTIPAVAASTESGYKVVYDGGSISGAKTGSPLKLRFDSSRITLTKGKAEVVKIPSGAITEISYGQDVHRRVGAAIGLAVVSLGIGALMALTKSKKHYIGLTWDDAGQKGGAAFRADKSDYRGVLAGLGNVCAVRSGSHPADDVAWTGRRNHQRGDHRRDHGRLCGDRWQHDCEVDSLLMERDRVHLCWSRHESGW